MEKMEKMEKVTNLLRKAKIETDYCSPNLVAEFATEKNIKLTSDEVVYISDHYELEEDFGVFTYQKKDDECIYQEYFDNKKDAIVYAKSQIKMLENDLYIEVWQKEEGCWGTSGETLFKSDK